MNIEDAKNDVLKSIKFINENSKFYIDKYKIDEPGYLKDKQKKILKIYHPDLNSDKSKVSEEMAKCANILSTYLKQKENATNDIIIDNTVNYDSMSDVQSYSAENEYINGSNIKKPRNRDIDESDKEYEEYLKDYYESQIFELSQSKTNEIAIVNKNELSNVNKNELSNINKNELNNAKINEIEQKKEEKEANKEQTQKLDLPAPQKIEKLGKRPKMTWKTAAWIVAGFTSGALVGFSTGPMGTLVANLGAGLAKAGLEHQKNKFPKKVEIKKVELTGIKGKIEKLKNYLQSEEGIRDMQYGLTSFMIGTSAGKVIQSFNVPNVGEINTVNNSIPGTENNIDNIRIGDQVGDYNVSTGHDTASWAVNDVNSETLVNKYVNSDSVFKRFAVINPDGSHTLVNTPGLSINDVASQYGVDPSRIAVDVGKNGVSQAWTSVTDLVKDVGGMSR